MQNRMEKQSTGSELVRQEKLATKRLQFGHLPNLTGGREAVGHYREE